MTIRLLTPADLDAHCRVSSAAFIWEYKPEEETFPAHSQLLGCFDGDEMIAGLEFAVRDATWGGGTVPCVCIGGVASLPNRRHGGAVRKLFEDLHARAKQEGWAFGALYPFRDAYYRKFGYGRHFHALRLTAPMEVFDAFAAAQPREALGRMELYEEGKYTKELLGVYNAYAKQRPLMLHRGEAELGRFYGKPFETCAYCYLWKSPAGAFEGYVQYKIDREAHSVQVEEFCALTDAAARGMLVFLRGYASKTDSVTIAHLPPDSPVPDLLGEYSLMKIEWAVGPSLCFYDDRITPEAIRAGTPPQFWDGF